MKHVSWGRLVAATLMLSAPTACGGGGGGGDRPSVDAIVASLRGSSIVSDLSTDEVRCFAQALHDGEIPSATLTKFVSDGDVTQSEIDLFNRTAPDAAAACGFTYVVG
jgi:hypothetical protein